MPVLDVFQLPFVQRGLVEILILAVPAGLLGTWIVLRVLSFFSHAVGTKRVRVYLTGCPGFHCEVCCPAGNS